jgi:hypothetical protein
VAQHIASEGLFLHGAGLASHVHQDERQPAVAGDVREAEIGAKSGNVIQNFGTSFRGCFGDFRFAGVDGNGNFDASAHFFDDRKNAAEFFVSGNSPRAGARGLAADIENVGSGLFDFEGARNRCAGIKIAAAVGETVRRDVEDAHQESFFTEDERARGKLQRESLAMKHGPLLNHDFRQTISGVTSSAFMSHFADAREAKEFLVSRILAEAEREKVPLSEIERKMLYFSETGWTLPDIMEVNEQFDREYDQAKYEKKIAHLIRNESKRLRKESPQEFASWMGAIRRLKKEDHYILVMVDKAGLSAGTVSDKWKGVILAVIGVCAVKLSIQFCGISACGSPTNPGRIIMGAIPSMRG